MPQMVHSQMDKIIISHLYDDNSAKDRNWKELKNLKK